MVLLMRFRTSLLASAFLRLIAATGQALAATAIVKDGGTLQLAGNDFRLDGIDAPAVDQMCIDEHADSWACGVEAREQLAKLVGGKQVRCGDLGPDPAYKKRRIGLCIVEGETASLGQLWSARALRCRPQGKVQGGRDRRKGQPPRALERLLRGARRFPSLEKGCRARRRLMPARTATRKSARVLFPADPVMPPGCAIKGKYAVRARVTGNVGIYHLQACRSYPGLNNSERWFCSEEDAQAAGFRKAYNCGGKAK